MLKFRVNNKIKLKNKHFALLFIWWLLLFKFCYKLYDYVIWMMYLSLDFKAFMLYFISKYK